MVYSYFEAVMNSKILQEMLSEYEQEFHGWDFSYLNNKTEEAREPWDY